MCEPKTWQRLLGGEEANIDVMGNSTANEYLERNPGLLLQPIRLFHADNLNGYMCKLLAKLRQKVSNPKYWKHSGWQCARLLLTDALRYCMFQAPAAAALFTYTVRTRSSCFKRCERFQRHHSVSVESVSSQTYGLVKRASQYTLAWQHPLAALL